VHSIFDNPENSGASESPGSSADPAEHKKGYGGFDVRKKVMSPTDQMVQEPNSDNEYGFTPYGIPPQMSSKMAQKRIQKQREVSITGRATSLVFHLTT
jgi:hypothetical protein